jgi:hypothetical protein
MFELRSVEELMKVVAAGGGIRMDGSKRLTNDLMKIASAAKHRGARITFTNMAYRSTEELMQIGAAGQGQVVFEGA